MRIRRLDLTRYGHFTDFPLEFGNDPDGSNFHVIYGPNEAGKSTIRNAFVDLLYGISPRTPYNFLHANDVLQIGGTLRIGEQDQALIRVRKNANDLLDASGQPVSENVLKAVLGDISRDSFCSMFSLDDETLQEGGESILKSEGDLGELLFSAAAGLAGFSRMLDQIRDEASAFYKPSGRKHELASAKKELAELESNIRELDTHAHEYEQLFKEEATKREAHRAAKADREENARRASHVKALVDALALWRERQKRVNVCEALEEAPPLPDGWLEEAQALVPKDAAAWSACERTAALVQRAKAALDAIVIDQEILGCAEAIERLHTDDLEARYKSAKDIAQRERDRETIKGQINDLVRELGQAERQDPDSLLLPAALIAKLRDLIGRRSGVESAREAAKTEYARAIRAHDEATAAHAEFDDIVDLLALANRVSELREEVNDRQLARAEKALVDATEELRASLAVLAPWAGTAEQLVMVILPSQSAVEALKARQEEKSREERANETESERLEDEKATLSAKIAAEIAAQSEIDDDVARDARASRDEEWDRHCALFKDGATPNSAALNVTAAAFTAAMAEDDRVGATRFQHSTEVAAIRHSKVALAECDAGLSRLDEKQEAVRARALEIQGAIEKVMASLGLPAETELEFLGLWLQRRDQALKQFTKQKAAQQERNEIAQSHDAAKQELFATMSVFKMSAEGLSWAQAITQCDLAIESWKKRQGEEDAAARALKVSKDDVAERKRIGEDAQVTHDEWTAKWSEALSACWMGAAKEELSPIEVNENLRILGEIANKLTAASDLENRICAMEADRQAYIEEVERLASETGTTAHPEDPLKTADALRARLKTASDEKRRRQEKESELKELKDEAQEAVDAAAEIKRRFDEFSAVYPSNDFTELVAIMRRAKERAALQEQIDSYSDSICSILSVATIDEAETLLADLAASPEEVASLKAEHESITAATADEENHVSELFLEWKSAEKVLAAISGDARVARLEEQRRALLLEIEAKSESFLKRSAGIFGIMGQTHH